jgi:hypothetical protein
MKDAIDAMGKVGQAMRGLSSDDSGLRLRQRELDLKRRTVTALESIADSLSSIRRDVLFMVFATLCISVVIVFAVYLIPEIITLAKR